MTELTNEWLQFLVQHGACLNDETPPQILSFNAREFNFQSASDFVAPLTDLGIIAVTGDEAAHFLHGQLTNNMESMGSDEARLAGYCSPKGRLLATLLCWRSGDALMLQLPRQILAATQKRLQMFVLRAKARLQEVSDDYVVLGMAGHQAEKALTAWFPQLPSAPYHKQESDDGTLIRLTDIDGAPRFQWIMSNAVAIKAWPVLTRSLIPASPSAWRLSEVHAGIPGITLATQEQFVPQMINFELIGGVNFKKGCYPGQEIVARSQYRGKLKRRMLLATVAGAAARPGIEVFDAADPDQPCGMIVNAEISGTNHMDCLVEMKLEAADVPVHLGSANGPVLQFKPLPYLIPESDPVSVSDELSDLRK
ncbi:MAG: YgfZ/GcvT domain-containing protein [Burkholderiales bacterium]